VAVTFKVGGIFALGDAIRASDEANPGMFDYSVSVLGLEMGEGKFVPREFTEKEKEMEESKKKGAKKGAKVEEEEKKTP
jgi:hypothetical protein